MTVVAEKPRIVESPKDVTAKENSDVIFHCRATGDPEPTVIWKKLDGQIAPERSRNVSATLCTGRLHERHLNLSDVLASGPV